MPNPIAEIERYIGGGKTYFTPWDGSAYGAELEIGENKSASLKITPTFADATSKDSGIDRKVDKVVIGIEASISFSTQNVNTANMAMAMLAESTTETFAIGATLPDGTVAIVEEIIPVIIGGKVPKIEGKLRVVGVNVSGSKNPVLVVPLVTLTPSGETRDYFADKHATISFDGEIMEIGGEYFKEYFMPKA